MTTQAELAAQLIEVVAQLNKVRGEVVSALTRIIKDVDVTRPNTPTGLSGTPVSETQINLSWNAATDPSGLANEAVTGVVGYRLYRNSALRIDQAGRTFNDTALAAYTVYSYQVSAYDAAGNESILSTAIVPRTLDTTAPTAPTITASATSSSSISVALTTPSTDTNGSGVATYRLEYKRTADSTWLLDSAALTAGQFPRSIGSLTASTQYDTRCRATDVAGNVGAFSATSQATTQASSSLWSWSVPTQADEQATWDLLGMAWTPSDKNTEFAASPSVPTPDWHDDTEGDDLWTHYQMYRRTIATNPSQAAIYLAWAQAWRNRFVNDYVNDMGSQTREQEQGYIDHVYGQGMIVYAHFVTDAAALTAAGNVGALIAAEPFTIGSTAMSFSGARGRARWLIVSCYLAEKIGAPWITLRNNIIDAWLQSPDWRADVIGRMTFVSAAEASYHPPPDSLGGTPAYNAGRRYIGTFHVALLAEALWRAYLATGRADVRTRLEEMAYWCYHYASDPSWVNPMVGTYIGSESSGARFIRETDSGNVNTSSGASEYSLCMVNMMTIGYKLTGWRPFLNEAHRFLKIGQKWGAGAYGAANQVADGQVHHFLDTLNNPDAVYFDYNKGELQYAYLVFENSGVPTVFAGT